MGITMTLNRHNDNHNDEPVEFKDLYQDEHLRADAPPEYDAYIFIDKTKTHEEWIKKQQKKITPTPKAVPVTTGAKTLKEAEKYVTSELEIPYASYKGLDIVTANTLNSTLKAAFDRFPEIKKNFSFVGETTERNKALKPLLLQKYMDELRQAKPGLADSVLAPYAEKRTRSFMREMAPGNSYAQSWSPSGILAKLRGITVSKKYGSDAQEMDDMIKRDVANKFHPVGCDSIKAIIDHEIGHQLDDLLSIRSISDVKQLYDSRSTSQMTNELSIYSWKNENPNNYSEMIAEAWSEYVNNLQPREIARKIGETIESEYKLMFYNAQQKANEDAKKASSCS